MTCFHCSGPHVYSYRCIKQCPILLILNRYMPWILPILLSCLGLFWLEKSMVQVSKLFWPYVFLACPYCYHVPISLSQGKLWVNFGRLGTNLVICIYSLPYYCHYYCYYANHPLLQLSSYCCATACTYKDMIIFFHIPFPSYILSCFLFDCLYYSRILCYCLHIHRTWSYSYNAVSKLYIYDHVFCLPAIVSIISMCIKRCPPPPPPPLIYAVILIKSCGPSHAYWSHTWTSHV